MTDLPWASPDRLARLTLPQLLCLLHERPPGAGAPCRSFAEYQAALEKQEAADATWDA